MEFYLAELFSLCIKLLVAPQPSANVPSLQLVGAQGILLAMLSQGRLFDLASGWRLPSHLKKAQGCGERRGPARRMTKSDPAAEEVFDFAKDNKNVCAFCFRSTKAIACAAPVTGLIWRVLIRRWTHCISYLFCCQDHG